MCGIAGFCSFDGDRKRNIEKMKARMLHRGPDAGGSYFSEDGQVTLGHRRLSIVDLSENGAQPDVFRNAFSGIWWSMSTLLTVGYGDIYPITTLGRVMAICIAYLGVGAVAIPTGIISAGFVEQYQRKSGLSNIKNADIKEIAEILADRRYAGKTIEEIETADQLTIFLILRDNLSVLPQKDTVIKLNDILVIRGENEN